MVGKDPPMETQQRSETSLIRNWAFLLFWREVFFQKFMYDLRRSSSKQASGTPTKKLLAEESSKDMESKRRPPSVIARLMGLDALPPQQPVHKQPKIFSENYLQKTASIENKPSYESRSLRRKQNKEHIEFKDVFEVLETSKTEEQSQPSVQKGLANAKPREAKMAFIKQKFMDAKRLSTDEELRQSKEFHDALNVLDSNKDLLLKFLQEPDSLFTKHICDLHKDPPPHQFGHGSVSKSANASKHAHTDICWKAERKTDQWEAMNSFQKEFCHGRDGSYNLSKNIKSRSEEKNEDCGIPNPTRIVVLKPNTGKAQIASRSANASRSASSSSSISFQSGCRIHGESQSCENHQLFAEVWNRKNSSNNMRHRSKSSKEISKEITRQMRQGESNSSVRVSSLGPRSYAGDESSYSVAGMDSANELEAVPPTSRHILDQKNKYSPSTSCSTESSVHMEAKKQLSERWKMTSRFQEVGLVGKGSSRSTLGEMLAMPDREIQTFNLGSCDGLTKNDGMARWGSPIGISSRDGWKDGYSRDPRGSKSVPELSFVFGSPKSGIGHGAIRDDRCLMSKNINQGSYRSRVRNSNHTEDSFLRNIRSKNEKYCSSFSTNRENNHVEQATHLSLYKPKGNLVERDQADQKLIIPEPLSCDVADKRSIVEEVLKTRDTNRLTETPEEKMPESTACIMLDTVGDSIHDTNESILKDSPDQSTEEGSLSANCSLPEPESPGSFKEVDQPSPVSVLEPFVEDMSSGSECFERVSADLNGLRTQLQLLKSETSDPYGDEFGMNVSSDEETWEESVNHLEEKGKNLGILRTGGNRDFSYVIDVFVDTGFDGVHQEIVLAAWHSLECPIGLEMFEKLEKKYGEQLTWPRSERRLLFDRINHGLMDIFWPCMDPHPWVKPAMRRLSTPCGEHLVEELWKLLVDRGQKGSNEASEKGLEREMRWLELGDEIDIVGKEIEKLLLDELIEEVISM
ncbi:uncharacterized protein LOC122069386 isoform X2 [Macadamia integrifolia]|uniref:uncharacterized protein LOC122069386 isoform X2 n=1 Tax=Macadamia integrifolia TaxID=60698 RepID=UPI001C4E3488|nr:uncharacterized protein LOC122069386 isoform X2 [Macadamia integrifolia]